MSGVTARQRALVFRYRRNRRAACRLRPVVALSDGRCPEKGRRQSRSDGAGAATARQEPRHILTRYVNFPRRRGWREPPRTESRRAIAQRGGFKIKISGFKAPIAQIEAHESRTRFLIRVQNQSSWTVCSATAAARGGAREGRPRRSTIRPMYHWTDSMIRVHVFYCVLALTIASLLVRQLHLKGIASASHVCSTFSNRSMNLP